MANNQYKKYKKYKVHPSVYNRQQELDRRAKEEGRIYYSHALMAVCFVAIILVMGLLAVALPKPTESEYERRELARMPEFSVQALFAGTYLRDVEEFYSDTFPFRDGFVRMAALLDEVQGIRVDGVRMIDATPKAPEPEPLPEPSVPVEPEPVVSVPESSQEEPAEPEEPAGEEYTPYVVEDDGAEGEQTTDGLFIYKNRVMAIFGGNRELGTYYAETLNNYAEKLGPDVTVYDAVIPTAIEFGLPERYKSVSNSEKNAIDHIYDQLDKVVPVDAYSALERHAGEYIYFNTDHHWTVRGAYYAYTAYCEAAGLMPLAIEDYEVRVLNEDFLGTLYNQTNDSAVKSGADRVEYFIVPGEFDVTRYEKNAPTTPIDSTVWAEYASGAYSYSVFLHGDYPLVEMKTNVNNGRKAVVIKESFGNAFAPFLLAHYEEVYVVDHRYFTQGLATFISDHEINDVIFLKNVFAANTKFHIEDIRNMMY